MPAYAIFHAESIEDPVRLAEYKKAALPTVIAAGGKLLVAYGQQEVVEGPPLIGVIMIEFPTYEMATTWYHSDSYKAVRALREGATTLRVVIVEGVAPPAQA